MSVDRVGLFPALANAARPRRRSRSMSDASTAPLLGEDAPAKPSLLGTEALSARQALLDDRIRTLSLVICASGMPHKLKPSSRRRQAGLLLTLVCLTMVQLC
jgi:hypothetical protein